MVIRTRADIEWWLEFSGIWRAEISECAGVLSVNVPKKRVGQALVIRDFICAGIKVEVGEMEMPIKYKKYTYIWS